MNSWFNLITRQPNINKIYLYAKDPYKAKYQFLITKPESTALKYLNDFDIFIEYSIDMDDL